MNFGVGLAHHRLSVAQLLSIGARSPKIWDPILMGTQNFFFVSRLAECVNFLSMEKTENNNHKIECVSNLVEL